MKFIAKITFILGFLKLLASARHVQDIQEIEADRGKCTGIGVSNIFDIYYLYLRNAYSNTYDFILQSK